MPKNNSDGRRNRTIIIFMVQYINTAIIYMLVYMSFLHSEKKRLQNDQNAMFVGPFDEFNSRWYLTIGTPIALTIIFQIFTPHLGLFAKSVFKCLQRWADRAFGFNDRRTR